MMSKPYGTTYFTKSGKLHKRHKAWHQYSRCGSTGLKYFYETTEDFTVDELCKRCFKKELTKRQEIIKSFLLPEELFEI